MATDKRTYEKEEDELAAFGRANPRMQPEMLKPDGTWFQLVAMLTGSSVAVAVAALSSVNPFVSDSSV